MRTNLAALLAAAADGSRDGPATVYSLEAASGIGKTTIYRILSDDPDCLLTLTTLIKLAAAYELPVWQFLYPKLDPLHPPHILTQAEREEHEQWHVVYLQVQAIANGRASSPGAPSPSSGNDSAGENPGPKPLPPYKRTKYPRP